MNIDRGIIMQGFQNKRFASHLKLIGLSQTAFAERIGTSSNAVSEWCRKGKPGEVNYRKILRELNLQYGSFLMRSNCNIEIGGEQPQSKAKLNPMKIQKKTILTCPHCGGMLEE